MYEVGELEYKIKQMRETLIVIAIETGLNSEDTLCYSQKLDELIVRYQKLKMIHTQKKSEQSYIVTL